MQVVPGNVIEDIAEAAVKHVIYSIVLKRVIAKAILMMPFLGLPFINPVFLWAMGKVANLIYEELSTFVAFRIIEIRTAAQKEAYNESVAAFKEVYKRGSNEEIERARAEFEKRLADLARLKPV